MEFLEAVDKVCMECVRKAETDCNGCMVRKTVKELTSSTKEVIEPCPCCGNTIVMQWNTYTQGFKAYCPVCGNRLMLCDECMHRTGECVDDCDYNDVTDTCRFNNGEK